jgi:cyclase
MPSGYEVVVSGGTRPVGKDVVAWARECEALDAGAILPASIDTDGVQEGYDLALTRAIADAVGLSVIAPGGASTLKHFCEGAVQGGAQILFAASVFHYCTSRIHKVKAYLQDKEIEVRM